MWLGGYQGTRRPYETTMLLFVQACDGLETAEREKKHNRRLPHTHKHTFNCILIPLPPLFTLLFHSHLFIGRAQLYPVTSCKLMLTYPLITIYDCVLLNYIMFFYLSPVYTHANIHFLWFFHKQQSCRLQKSVLGKTE